MVCVWMTKQPHTKAFKTHREKEKKEGKVIEGRSGKRRRDRFGKEKEISG